MSWLWQPLPLGSGGNAAYTSSVTAASITLTGQALTSSKVAWKDSITAATITLTGQALTASRWGRVDAITADSISISSQDVSSLLALLDAITEGGIYLAGETAGSNLAITSAVTESSFLLVGQSPNSLVAFLSVLLEDSIVLAGSDVVSTYSSGAVDYSSPVDSSILLIVGSTVGSTYQHTQHAAGRFHRERDDYLERERREEDELMMVLQIVTQVIDEEEICLSKAS